jgi:hypothetical protein
MTLILCVKVAFEIYNAREENYFQLFSFLLQKTSSQNDDDDDAADDCMFQWGKNSFSFRTAKRNFRLINTFSFSFALSGCFYLISFYFISHPIYVIL